MIARGQGMGQGEGVDCKEAGGIFWSDRIVLYLDCSGEYMTVYPCRNLANCMLWWVNFIVCKLYLTKDDLKTQSCEDRHYYPYFTDGKTEIREVILTCLSS